MGIFFAVSIFCGVVLGIWGGCFGIWSDRRSINKKGNIAVSVGVFLIVFPFVLGLALLK